MIPKIFHRVWIGKPNQEADLLWSKSKDIHPDWEHVTYSSKLPDGFEIISDVVENNDIPSYHSDLIRLEALYKFGGFYVDTDVEEIGRAHV
jgi:mannosyltransferase OCH1-like enzyme